MRVRNSLLLAAALGGGLALSAAGQTGRIALASHGEGVMDAGKTDNFGYHPGSIRRVSTELQLDSIVHLNDSTAMWCGRYREWPLGSPSKNATWQKYREPHQFYQRYYYVSRLAALDSLRRMYPQAKMVGFDKLLKRKKAKPSSQLEPSPKRPFQYSYWRGLATVAALGAVGWLLGRKAKTV